MIRGTTAPFKFKVPYAWSDICAIEATFSQKKDDGNQLSIIKEYDTRWGENVNPGGFTPDEKDPYVIYVVLDPEETLCFSDKRKAQVQIKVYCQHKGTVANRPAMFTVYPINNDSILEDAGEPAPGDNGMRILDAGKISGGDL
jgi:hypothetical protein